MGDPAGIGAEVILKAAAELARRRSAPALAVVGDLDAMRAAARRTRSDVPQPREWCLGTKPLRPSDGLAVICDGTLSSKAAEPGCPTVEGADAAYRYILTGARMALAGEVDALVTAPINKEWLNRAGHHFPGHSELLAKLSGARLWRMMFAGDQLRLALVT
ncbi:MAG: 4-hydroxythreonine-4-phosphate dehydrogenase PdxA, partial [Candidatus Binataceae bacterium]